MNFCAQAGFKHKTCFHKILWSVQYKLYRVSQTNLSSTVYITDEVFSDSPCKEREFFIIMRLLQNATSNAITLTAEAVLTSSTSGVYEWLT